MDQRFNRLALLVGTDGLERLKQAHVAVFGLGGVGSWAVEALARSGVGYLTLIDADTVAPSNINRQLPALDSTLGMPKTEVMKARITDINPTAKVEIFTQRYEAAKALEWDLDRYNWIIDAIDSLSDKAALILQSTQREARCRLVSSMGAARRLDPLKVTSGRFTNVTGDALAAALRRYFRRRHIFPQKKFTCIFSTEQPIAPIDPRCSPGVDNDGGMLYDKVAVNGASCTVTTAFGMALASTVINGILKTQQSK